MQGPGRGQASPAPYMNEARRRPVAVYGRGLPRPGLAASRGRKFMMNYMQNRSPLSPTAFLDLPLGAIEPTGWLRNQLEIQAEGLSGHLDEFWPDVGPDSGWLGGSGESWERGPYYLDGLLPLAYLLKDERLIAKTQPWIEWTLASQGEDGQFGPRTNEDWWSRMIMLKVMIQYAEATGDERVGPFLTNYYRFQVAHLEDRPLAGWSQARGGENMLC